MAEWFASWFDSPYYPILYQHRDYAEAERFILQLLRHLAPAPTAHFLDLACGRGRHSVFLNQQGFRVTGLDLSPESIADARLSASETLDFAVHDMRMPLPGSYDYILNLFTSFGYFDDPSDNLRVLREARKGIRPGGQLVLDFMNVPRVLAGLVPAEKKTLQGIDFGITRSVEAGHIVKRIHIRDGDKVFDFAERVQALGRADFEGLFSEAGWRITETWGDYDGNPWREAESPRIIFFGSPA